MNPKLMDLYGALVADGTMTFAEAVDRLMRKQVEAEHPTDLIKAEDKTMTQLTRSITRTESHDAAARDLVQQRLSIDAWIATIINGTQHTQATKVVEQQKAAEKPRMRQRL